MVKTNSLKAWILASRPKTLTGAAVPVMIGIALALKDSGDDFSWLPPVLCLLFAFLMQIDSNLINDYFDFIHGNDDRETRLGPKRACAEGWITLPAMRWGILLVTALACSVGLPLIMFGGWEMIIVGALCVMFAFLYTTKLSYVGLGDVLVLVFFGLVPVCLTYFVSMPAWQQTISAQSIWYAVACGLVIDTLLMVNNFRDRDNDRRDGKRTLVVRLGAKRSLDFYRSIGLIAAVMIVIDAAAHLALTNIITLVLMLIYVILHLTTASLMEHLDHGRELNRVLALNSRNMFFFGLATVASILVNAWL